MPNRNRIDDLESEVDELKATVQGLTEELVETHERVRRIERALAGDVLAAREAAREVADEVAADVEEEIAGADPQEVARAAAAADPTVNGSETTEADKGEATEGSDEAEGIDDIIVA